MSNKTIKAPLAAAVGAAFAGSLLGATAANAADNPFSMTELSKGYQVADAKGQEGKCGASKSSAETGAMQGSMPSQMDEQKAGADAMGKAKEAQCGAAKSSETKSNEAK